MGSTIEVVFVILAMSLWFLFPIGLFVAMNHVDRSVDGVVKLGNESVSDNKKVQPSIKETPAWRPHWPVFLHRFRHH